MLCTGTTPVNQYRPSPVRTSGKSRMRRICLLLHSAVRLGFWRRRKRMSRPRLLGRLSMAMLILGARALAQEPAPAGRLRSYLQGIALQQLASRKERVSEILTPEQFEKRKAEVRHLLLTLMGGLPEKRADLKVQRMGTIDRGGCGVEKSMYHSLPIFLLAANRWLLQFRRPRDQ